MPGSGQVDGGDGNVFVVKESVYFFNKNNM